ncbi:MAG: helix-turn-helix domain-containing protein [Polyangiaceae bacterium]
MSGREMLETTGVPVLKRRGLRYDARERARAVEYARRRLGQGTSKRAIAGELGIAAPTLERWMAVSAFVPVELVEPSRGSVVVHGPAGLRVEGLSLVEIAELWRRLA